MPDDYLEVRQTGEVGEEERDEPPRYGNIRNFNYVNDQIFYVR